MGCTKKKGLCPNNGFQHCNTCDFNGVSFVGGKVCKHTGDPAVSCECATCEKEKDDFYASLEGEVE